MPREATWVLVADGAAARLLVGEGFWNGLRPALDQEFIGTNLESRDIASDRPGRGFDSGGEGDAAGHGRHAMETPTDPKRHAKREFASDVAAILETERKRNAFDRLVVIAPPTALGDLRSAFSDELRKMIVAEDPKDLVKSSADELADRVRDLLRP